MTSTSVPIQVEIERLEEAIMEQRKLLLALRRELPRTRVEDYALEGVDGPVRLSELFGAQDDLIVIHNMGSRCAHCTLWADGFNGQLNHFRSRAAFVVVSPDDPGIQQAFAQRRGWRFIMLSDVHRRFTQDMGFIREWEGKMGPWPGFSTFHRATDGTIARVASASFGPHDEFCPVWNMFELLDGGVGRWQPRLHEPSSRSAG